ncbi:MAG: GNAT family N-acetyltransferase [Ideonella sp.]
MIAKTETYRRELRDASSKLWTRRVDSAAHNIALAPYQDGDWPALADLLSDRLLLMSLYPQSLALAAQRSVMADWRTPPSGRQDFQLVVRLDDQRPVGCVRLENEHLSYFLGRPYWGQGVGRRALELMLAGLRDTHRGVVLHALVARDNVASCRLLQRNGFIFSGIVPGRSRLHCVQAFSYRVSDPAAVSLPAEKGEQSGVDRG